VLLVQDRDAGWDCIFEYGIGGKNFVMIDINISLERRRKNNVVEMFE
jgi:hypothetical protein